MTYVDERVPVSRFLGQLALVVGFFVAVCLAAMILAAAGSREFRYQLWKRDLGPALGHEEKHDFVCRQMMENIEPRQWVEAGGTEGEITPHVGIISCPIGSPDRCQEAGDF
jgi:hypothetical protein